MIGNMNAITYKEVFPLIKENKMWLGNGFQAGNAYFGTVQAREYSEGVFDNDTGLVKFRNCQWFTNIDHGRRHQPLDLLTMAENKKFNNKIIKNENSYVKYDNYDAIEVPVTAGIPSDYNGVMGVPISFLDKYNPDQFEIIGMAQRGCHGDLADTKKYDGYIQMKSTGEVEGSNGRKIDEARVVVGRVENKTFYKNDKREVTSLYMRIFIKHRS